MYVGRAAVRIPLVLIWCMNCSEDAVPAVSEGAHFTFETDVVEVCAGTLRAIDREIVRIDGRLGVDSNEHDKAEVHVVPSMTLYEYCPDGSGGCTSGKSIYVRADKFAKLMSHELVHQRSFAVGIGGSEFLFQEGLAVALGRNECVSPDLDRPSLDDILGSDSALEYPSIYPIGGELLNWLLETHSSGSVLGFISEARWDMPPEELQAAYFDYLGTMLDDDIYGHLRTPRDIYSRAQTGCVATEAPRNGAVRSLRAAMRCDSEQVQNDFASADLGYADLGIVEWVVSVRSDESGYFELRGDIPDSLHFAIYPCVCDGANPTDFRHLDPPPVFAHDFRTQGRRVLLGAGDYRLFWNAPLDRGLELELEFAPICNFESQDCADDEQCTIWNSCEPEAAIVASIGEPCKQTSDGPLTCEVGSWCVEGVCTETCDADRGCAAGLVCGRSRICGPGCSLAAQDCGAGWSCVPTVDPELDAQGIGHCQPSGTAQALESCDILGSSCDVGLSCERVDDIELLKACGNDQLLGCCVPLCDPFANDPGCPAELPTCFRRFTDSQVGVCV